jgi:DNA-binding response OmpR family regulator
MLMPKIMLAEDDPTMLKLLKTLMHLEGFESVSLDPDENVLAAVAREAPDVLLLDVHLSQGNGLDFLRQMRADARFDNLIVLMASGMSLREECLAAGANQFLLKPFMPDVLIDGIHSLLKARSG